MSVCFRQLRLGGILTAIKTSEHCIELNNVVTPYYHILSVGNSVYAFINVYIVPDAKVADTCRFVNAVNDSIASALAKVSNVFICGDLNHVSPRVFTNFGFHDSVTFPTRGPNYLDHVLTNTCATSVSGPSLSDHKAIFTLWNNPSRRNSAKKSHVLPKRKCKYVYSINHEMFNLDIAVSQPYWNLCSEALSVDEQWDMISGYTNFCKQNATTRLRTHGTFVHDKLNRKYERLKRQCLMNNDLVGVNVWAGLIRHRNSVHFDTLSSKDKWNFIKKNISCTVSTDDEEPDLDSCNTHFLRFEENYTDSSFIHHYTPSPTLPTPIDTCQVTSILKKLKPSSAVVNTDDIPPVLLRKHADVLTVPFTTLFNKIISNQRFPSSWKLAKVIMVKKNKRMKLQASNARPIAITFSGLKAFELHILDILTTQLPVDQWQFAYRKGYSTYDALHTITDFVTSSLDLRSTYVDCLCLDFSSAFNTIHRSTLLSLLSKYTDDWIMNIMCDYFTDRLQFVYHCGKSSNLCTVSRGTLQGAILSPLLFAYYTHDLCLDVSNAITVKYADDTTMVISVNNPADITNCNAALNELCVLYAERGLILNKSKTKALRFINKNSKLNFGSICLDNNPVTYVDSLKLLGFTFDSAFSFSLHVDNLSVRADQITYYFYYLLRQFGLNTALTYLKSTLISSCTYGLEFTSYFSPKSNTTSLFSKIHRLDRFFDFNSLIANTLASQRLQLVNGLVSPVHPLHPLYLQSVSYASTRSKFKRLPACKVLRQRFVSAVFTGLTA